MTSLQRLAGALSDVVARTGDLAPLVLFGASLIEYVFPPFPGDLVVVLGAWYAAHGALSWPVTFGAVTAGSVAGAFIDHRIGRALGRRLDERVALRGTLSADRLARFEASYRRFGGLLLVASRFLPGVRAFIFIAAGAAGIPLRRVLLLGGLSAALWNALLLAAGAFLARNVDELVAIVDRYMKVASIALALAAVLALAVLLLRRRRAARATPERR